MYKKGRPTIAFENGFCDVHYLKHFPGVSLTMAHFVDVN